MYPGVQQATAAGEEIDALVARSNRMRTFAVGIFVILGAAALVLIANTIRMAVYARREEISIMRLVGAGNWFIRVPFLLEGLFEGVAGGALAALIVGLGHKPIVQMLSTVADPESIVVPVQFLLQQSLLVLAFGAVTGLLGSALGMWGTLPATDAAAAPPRRAPGSRASPSTGGPATTTRSWSRSRPAWPWSAPRSRACGRGGPTSRIPTGSSREARPGWWACTSRPTSSPATEATTPSAPASS